MGRVTAAMMKGKGYRTQDKPQQGTQRRALFDLLAPGKLIGTDDIRAVISPGASIWAAIEALNNEYALDIRHVGDCHTWCRVGEWQGGTYIDHIAPKFEAVA